MKLYKYYFHSQVAESAVRAIKNGRKEILLSLDLNLSHKTFEIKGDQLILDEAAAMDLESLRSVSLAKNKVFAWDAGQMVPLEVRSRGYHKLVPTLSAPILEIDGIKMHRSKEIDPLDDARLKTRLVVSPGDTVLDTCGGLGYSALYALKAGADTVVSFEKNQSVILLRDVNPWLKKYADSRLELTHGDITRKIDCLTDGMFNSVIHDPPRFTSSTGDLYGKKFYDNLFRVMASGAKLFHYTGSPKKIKTQDRFIKNAMKRLENSGFQAVKFHDNLQGIYARKK